jgi:DNA-binding CsgD family transcriptional regulator/catechol 2,3-dioxygenase-like lactoylglutathione lyase family enzyme
MPISGEEWPPYYARAGGGKTAGATRYDDGMRGRGKRGRPQHDDVLTPAEWRVVNGVRHGMSNGQIAKRRGISLDAVKFHVANAIAKLGLENRQQLKVWRGAPKDSALKTQEKRVKELQLGQIGQISRTVANIDQAQEWYGKVLGLKHLYTFGKLAFFDCGGTRLYLSQENGKPGPESCLYLRVEDIDAAHEELKARGVEFSSAPHLIFKHADGTEEWMAFFKDPEGRTLAIMAQIKPKSQSAAQAG